MKFPSRSTFQAISRLIGTLLDTEISELMSTYYDKITREIHHRGVKSACTYYKALYSQAIHIACGLPITPIPFRKSNRDGVCKDLYPFIPYLKGNAFQRRSALTILRMVYLLYTTPSINLKTITDPSGGTWSHEWTDIKDWLNKSQKKRAKSITPLERMLRRSKIPEPKEFFIIPRAVSGPNGSSSLFSSHKDALALLTKPNLMEAVCEISRREGLQEQIQQVGLWYNNTTKPSLSSLRVGKLVGLSEGGCKTRTIAIADLFTQCSLKPVHDLLMERLREIDQDGTWNQQKVIQTVKEWTTKGRNMYSFDLSSATDRFPLQFQELVMEKIFGKRYASLWSDVISKLRSFGVQGSEATVRYSVGQPMGVYSSWPAFTLSHHVFVQYCAYLEGKKSFKDYVIIGDDVMIRGKKVANRYRTLMTSLGVSISKEKSLISEKIPHSAEIAKAILWNGIDLSPIPPKLLLQSLKDDSILLQLVKWVQEHYGLSKEQRWKMALPLSRFLKGPRRRNAFILLTFPGDISAVETQVDMSNRYSAMGKSPWVEVLSDFTINEIMVGKEYLRKVDILKKYDDIHETWTISPNLEYEGLTLPNGKNVPQVVHPAYQAYAYVNYGIDLQIESRLEASILDTWVRPIEDFELGRLADPTMRDYMSIRDRRARSGANIVLKTLACFRKRELPNYNLGDSVMPEYLLKSTQIHEAIEEIIGKQKRLEEIQSRCNEVKSSLSHITSSRDQNINTASIRKFGYGEI